MYGTHLPTSMYFRVFSKFLDDIANTLPRWVLASDTKLTVSSTAFTYNACTKLKTTYGDKVCVLNSIRTCFYIFPAYQNNGYHWSNKCKYHAFFTRQPTPKADIWHETFINNTNLNYCVITCGNKQAFQTLTL